MHHTALLSLGAATLASAAALAPAYAAAADAEQASATPHTVVSIREDGVHDVPLSWFDDAVVVPGDRDERTIVVRNDRDLPISVAVTIDDVRPQGGDLLRDLIVDWGVASTAGADLVSAPGSAEAVTLEAGDELSVRLAYEYPSDRATPPGESSVTFDVLIRASADDGAGDGSAGGSSDGPGDGSDGGSGGDGSLAGTGGVFGGQWPAVVALVLATAGAVMWVFGGRRRREAEADGDRCAAAD